MKATGGGPLYYLFPVPGDVRRHILKMLCNHERFILLHALGLEPDYELNTFPLALECINSGYAHLLEWLLDEGLPLSELMYCLAAKYGQLDCLKVLYSKKTLTSATIWSWAAANFNLSTYDFLLENKCEWDRRATLKAAKTGNLRGLQFLHENGCPHFSDICSSMAANNDLAMLVYAHENNFYWDEKTTAMAAQHASVECFRYAWEKKCPVQESLMSYALRGGSIEILQILYNK